MSSDKQIAANRRNAAKSSGHRTPKGRASSSRNALRHGLSRPIDLDPALAGEIAEVARQLVGEEASPVEVDLAKAATESQIEVLRIRRQRQMLDIEHFQIAAVRRRE